MFSSVIREALNDWKIPKRIARVWSCGDECCCCEARVEDVSPNLVLGPPFVNRNTLRRGTFFSGPTAEEYDVIARELASMAQEFDVAKENTENLSWLTSSDSRSSTAPSPPQS